MKKKSEEVISNKSKSMIKAAICTNLIMKL